MASSTSNLASSNGKGSVQGHEGVALPDPDAHLSLEEREAIVVIHVFSLHVWKLVFISL